MNPLIADEALPKLVATLELAEATRLARTGRCGEADAVLSVARSQPAGVDLRARIAAQQRRYDEAISLWHEAAELLGNPDAFADELAAVRRLRQRRFGPAPLVVAGLVLGGALVDGALSRRSAPSAAEQSGSQVDDLAVLEQQVQEGSVALDGLAERLEEVAEGLEPPSPGVLEGRLGDVEGVDVTQDEEALKAQLTIPVFAQGDTFTPSGQAVLAELAGVLASDGGSYVVLVTGHTDALPLRPGGKFADNEELARARAQAAVSELVAAGLTTDRLATTVTAAPPPYGDDDTDPRNRTITLTIYEQPRSHMAASSRRAGTRQAGNE